MDHNDNTALYVPEEWKDPRFNYSWCLDEKKSMTISRFKGYEPVRSADPDARGFRENRDPRLSPDGLIRVGDVILMRCPKEKVEQRRATRRRQNRAAVRAVSEEFHQEAANLGVTSFEETTKP